MERRCYDVLILGSGGAGMRAAVAAADAGASVCVVSKGAFGVSGATVTASADVNADSRSIRERLGLDGDGADSPRQYYEDTMEGGCRLNDPALVEALVTDAPERAAEMIAWGAHVRHVYRQPGHRYPRGLWILGREFAHVLMKQVRQRKVDLLEHHAALRLLKNGETVNGALLLDLARGTFLAVGAKAVILATGGAMNVFEVTTAPSDLMGEGQSMAYRAGAALVDMEFPMFIPGCCMPKAAQGVNFPFTLLLMAGAHLYNKQGERFMERLDPVRKENTTRDILCVGMAKEILDGNGTKNGGVWASLKHLPDNAVDYFFEWSGAWHGTPADRYECFQIPDLMPEPYTEAVETRPAAHFWNGGVKIDAACRTSLPGLYAAGEVTGGVHGANRLSGNAMTDILVFGARAGASAAAYALAGPMPPLQLETARAAAAEAERFLFGGDPEERAVSALAREIRMGSFETIGPVRSEEGLVSALALADRVRSRLPGLRCSYGGRVYNREWMEALGLAGMADILSMTAAAALLRKESRGSHYRREYPDRRAEWERNIVLTLGSDGAPQAAVQGGRKE